MKNEQVSEFIQNSITQKDIEKWFKGTYSRHLQSVVNNARNQFNFKEIELKVYESGVVHAETN